MPRESSIGVVPLRVLTRNAPPARVLNIAQGDSLSVFPKPTLWLAVDVNVAMNSSVRPGANVPVVRAQAPSTRSDPPLTVTSPPAASTEDAEAGRQRRAVEVGPGRRREGHLAVSGRAT